MTPELKWPGNEEMIQSWFKIRDIFGEFFLWFESKRLNKTFANWWEYSDYIENIGIKEPWDVRIRELLKNVVESKKLETKTKMAKLLPVMPLVLFGINKNLIQNRSEYLIMAMNKMQDWKGQSFEMDWVHCAKMYLAKFHAGGAVKRALTM